MKSQNKVTKCLLLAMLALSTIIVLAAPAPVLAVTYTGTTTLTFSANPANLSGDSAADVTITTTTTAAGAPQALIDAGKVMIQLATDGLGNPVPAGSVVAWVALNAPGQNPVSGITTLDVDLDALGFVCGTVGGFRAHYVTGGGQNKVDTHFSAPVDLTAACNCEWIGETAWAAGTRYQNPGNWATYTPYAADSTVTLYAGQTLDAGTVHLSAPVDDIVTITITLNAGWRFADVAENVKIQDYYVAPSGNPAPGLFDWKGYATGSPFEIEVPLNNFYGVHVDVEQEVCE
jgi:hypothetical protein